MTEGREGSGDGGTVDMVRVAGVAGDGGDCDG
jgi:hypothetical protein